MEKSREFGNVKYIGLSYLEYQVVLLSFGITGLLCFEEDLSKYENVSQQELYNMGLASLYNRKLIINNGDSFEFSEEISAGFRILKNCKKILCADLINDSICCIYFDGGEMFVVIEPGNREGEYAKMSVQGLCELEDFLKENSYIKESSSINDVIDFSMNLPVEGKKIESFIDSLQNGLIKDFAQIKELEDVSVLLTVHDRNLADYKYYIAVIEQPIQDKLLVYGDGKVTLDNYSDREMMALINNLVR